MNCACGNPPAYWVRADGVDWVIPVCWRCALNPLSWLARRETEQAKEER